MTDHQEILSNKMFTKLSKKCHIKDYLLNKKNHGIGDGIIKSRPGVIVICNSNDYNCSSNSNSAM